MPKNDDVIEEKNEEELNSKDILAEKKSITANILSKTKEALASLMSNITKKEKEITKAMPKPELEQTDIAVNEINISSDVLPKNQEVIVEEKATNIHKVNPVIAMNIGQGEVTDIDEAIASVKEKKTGFITKKSNEEKVIALKDSNTTNIENIEKVDTKEEFIKLFSNTNDNFVKTVNIETPKIVVSHKNETEQLDNHKFVFKSKSQNTNLFSGNLGKTLLKNKNNGLINTTSNKYVFEKANITKSKFIGEVGKRIALSTN